MNAAGDISARRVACMRTLGPPLCIGLCAAAAVLTASAALRLAIGCALLLAPLLWFVISESSRWLILFFLTALLAPPLPVALGNAGPHVAVAFAGLGLIVGSARLGAWRLEASPVVVWLGAFFSVLWGSVAFALWYSGWAVGIGSLARVLLFGISCYVFLFGAYGPDAQPRPMLRSLYWLAAGSALFACLDFYYQWPAPAGYGPQFIWLDSGVFRRAQGVFYEASTLGNLCAFFLTMAALCMLRPREDAPVSRWTVVLTAPVIATALVLSYSRASLVNLGISLLVLLWLHRDRTQLRRLVIAPLALVSAGAALCYALFPGFARAYWSRAWLSAEYLFTATSGVLSGRVESWQRLSGFLLEHPWHLLFGVGYKTLPYSSFTGGPIVADNMYLSLLAETGFLGLAVFLALNAAILRTAWRARQSFCGALIFSFWLGQLFQMMSGDLLTYWRVIPVYFWVLSQAVKAERA